MKTEIKFIQNTYGNNDVRFAISMDTGRHLTNNQLLRLRKLLEKEPAEIDFEIDRDRTISVPGIKGTFMPSFRAKKINLDRKKHKAIFGPE